VYFFYVLDFIFGIEGEHDLFVFFFVALSLTALYRVLLTPVQRAGSTLVFQHLNLYQLRGLLSLNIHWSGEWKACRIYFIFCGEQLDFLFFYHSN